MESMGDRIKRLRLERGLTLQDVGDAVGVGKSTVRKWETGMIANMKRDKIAKLADSLGVTPGELMGWKEPEVDYILCCPPSEKERELQNILIEKIDTYDEHTLRHLLDYIKLMEDLNKQGGDKK